MSKYFKSSSLTGNTLDPRSTRESVHRVNNVHRTSEGYTENDLQLFTKLIDNRQSRALHPRIGTAPTIASVQYTEQDTKHFERLMTDTGSTGSSSFANTTNDMPDIKIVQYDGSTPSTGSAGAAPVDKDGQKMGEQIKIRYFDIR